MGPHQAYGNIPRSIEYATDWISNCIKYLQQNSIKRIEPTEKGVQERTEHVHDISKGFLTNNVDSWMTGVNKNVAGRQKRIVARYNGTCSSYFISYYVSRQSHQPHRGQDFEISKAYANFPLAGSATDFRSRTRGVTDAHYNTFSLA